MLIDIHTHFVPEHLPFMANRAGGDRWPAAECVCGQANHKNIMISGKNFRTITNQCWSPVQRLANMEQDHVATQVLSPMPELLSYWFNALDTLDFSRYINSQLSEFIQSNPNRFWGLGMVPLQDPEMAAREVRTLKRDFGFKGVEIGTNINGKSIGDPVFSPFFAEAEAEGMVVFVHALHPVGKERIVGPPSLSGLITFPAENAFAIASLITGGILEKFPNLKIAVSHGGGSFSTVLPRLQHGWETMDEVKKVCPHPPNYYAKKIFYDTLVNDKAALSYLIEKVGASQLMVGSDYPFGTHDKNLIEELNISQMEKDQINFKNALQFYSPSVAIG